MSGNIGDFNQNFYSFPDQQPDFLNGSSTLSFERDSTVFSDDKSYLNRGEFASVYDGLQSSGYHLPEEILGFSNDATVEEDFFVATLATTTAATTAAGGGGGGLYAPNSPMTASSSNDQLREKDCRDVNDASKNVCGKMKKKVEKPPRIAFLTKSDYEQLEDGYRWRKYGQKNVKNSPYPRSYYRCTTRNCPVKKRVERMFENPSTVMTTYEGQHIHQYPVTPALKGNSQVFSPPPPPQPSSSLGFFKQQPSVMQRQIYSQINGGLLQTNKTSTSTSLQQQKQPLPSLDFSIDFGFLEDDLGSRN
ncbi:hypothetical protein ZOSMA_99G00720 [Zostera marina]|uniref:WRKY domain-containing protein n=1 Tax=Zostera marina TaxID=29655 RepID=A0A0K9NHB4_ZOSMR|nr:hypothetical protein ZOSMA_99G00720 [Zostera marina]